MVKVMPNSQAAPIAASVRRIAVRSCAWVNGLRESMNKTATRPPTHAMTDTMCRVLINQYNTACLRGVLSR